MREQLALGVLRVAEALDQSLVSFSLRDPNFRDNFHIGVRLVCASMYLARSLAA